MNEKFSDFKDMLLEAFPDAKVQENEIIYFKYEDIDIAAVSLNSDPDMVIFRARVCALDEMKRPGDFAIAALSGNFFWSGTNGGTLSLSSDNFVYLTDKCFIDDLASADDILNFLDDYTEAVGNWKVRSSLYA